MKVKQSKEIRKESGLGNVEEEDEVYLRKRREEEEDNKARMEGDRR